MYSLFFFLFAKPTSQGGKIPVLVSQFPDVTETKFQQEAHHFWGLNISEETTTTPVCKKTGSQKSNIAASKPEVPGKNNAHAKVSNELMLLPTGSINSITVATKPEVPIYRPSGVMETLFPRANP